LSAAFIDTSAFLSHVFEEPRGDSLHWSLGSFESLYASNLLEAEAHSAASRAGFSVAPLEERLSDLRWVYPDRPLSREIRLVSLAGVSLKGADLWHLACALYLAGDPKGFPFLTLDDRQAEAARMLGFKVLPEPIGGVAGVHEARVAYRARPSGRRKKAKGKH
jgi:hypothetical protein